MSDDSRIALSPILREGWYGSAVGVGDLVGHYLETRGRAADPHPLFLTD